MTVLTTKHPTPNPPVPQLTLFIILFFFFLVTHTGKESVLPVKGTRAGNDFLNSLFAGTRYLSDLYQGRRHHCLVQV
jgi:hypothetical protein